MILPSNPPIHAELHPACAEEVIAAIRWYRDIDLPLGFRLRSELRYAARQIILLPDAWPAYLYGTRRFVMRDFPFSLVYRSHRGGIQLIACAHAKRKPGYWRERMEG